MAERRVGIIIHGATGRKTLAAAHGGLRWTTDLA